MQNHLGDGEQPSELGGQEIGSPELPIEQLETTEQATRGSLLVIFLTVFIDLLGFGMVLPLLPIYAAEFVIDVNGWQIGLLMASFSAMQFIFAPIWGNLSDRVGRRPVLMVGLLTSVVFYTLFGIATIYQSLPWLFVTRIGAGIAGATIPTAQAYIADTTTLENRTKGMALIGIAFGMGFTFGPLLGFLAVPSGVGDPGPGPGFVAATLSAIAFCLAIFLLPESNREKNRDGNRKVFDFHAAKVAKRSPKILFVLFSIFMCVFAFANLETTLSMLLKDLFELGWGQICLSFAFIGFMCALIQGGVVRPLSMRLSESTLASGGAFIEVAGFTLVIVAILNNSIPILFAAMAVVAAGYSVMQPSLNSMLSKSSGEDQQGAMMGLGQSFNSMARILGAGLAIPLLRLNNSAPYLVGIAMMFVCGLLVIQAARKK